MTNIRLLTNEEISAVGGGATNTSGGFHPQPSPVDRLIQWIISVLR
jgi:hypothetical protein